MTSVQAAIEFLDGLDFHPPMQPDGPPVLDDEFEVAPLDWEAIFPPFGRVRGVEARVREAALLDQFGEAPSWVVEEFERRMRERPVRHDSRSKLDWLPNWDVAAWYQSIHYHRHYWGIYIREQAIWQLGLALLASMPSKLRLRRSRRQLQVMLWRAGLYAYYLHEQYHHKVESFGFRLAVVTQQPLYHQYKARVYSPNLKTDHCLEEALANADMYRRLGDNPYAKWLTAPVVRLLQNFLKVNFQWEPPGYRMAVHYLERAPFEQGENQLQSQIREANLRPVVWSKFESWDLAPRMLQSLFPVTSHIWTVVPTGSRSFGPTRASSPVGTCSTNDLVKWLKDFGYSIVTGGGRGSHIKLECPGYPTLTIPHDRDHLAPWIVKQALQALGLRGLGDLDRLRRGEVLPARGNR